MTAIWILEHVVEGILLVSVVISFVVAQLIKQQRPTLSRLPRLGLTFGFTYLFIVAAVTVFDIMIGRTFEALDAAGVQGPEMMRLSELQYLDTGRSLIVFTGILYATFNTLVVAAATWVGDRWRPT